MKFLRMKKKEEKRISRSFERTLNKLRMYNIHNQLLVTVSAILNELVVVPQLVKNFHGLFFDVKIICNIHI